MEKLTYIKMPSRRHCNGNSSAIMLATICSCSDFSSCVEHTNPFPVLLLKAWLIAVVLKKPGKWV